MNDSSCKEIYFDKDYVEQTLRQMGKENLISSEGYEISYPHYDVYYVSQGETMYTINIKGKYGRICDIEVPAPCFGYCFQNEAHHYGEKWLDKKIVLTLIEDPNLAADKYTIDAVITTDNFSGESELIWLLFDPNADEDDLNYITDLQFENITIKLILFESQPAMKVICRTNGEKYKKGDIFEMLFSEGNSISHTLTEVPHHYTKDSKRFYNKKGKIQYCEFYFILNKEDLNCLKNHSFVSTRLRSKNTPSLYVIGEQSVIVNSELTSILSRRYVDTYLVALEENGILSDSDNDIPSISTDPCYVYLMVDTANGYHKIGISNKPEYRERTLQSEKPSIELLCAKQYPSRTIAEAIEGALHKAFGEKRLRGEWFNLSDQDVIDLKITLS
jgi:hypothetical protein